MRKIFLPLQLIIIAAIVVSCLSDEPKKNLNTVEYRYFKDSSVNFKDFKTYHLKDSTYTFDGSQFPPRNFMKGSVEDSLILNSIHHHMKRLGYEYEPSHENADFGIAVSRVSFTYTGEQNTARAFTHTRGFSGGLKVEFSMYFPEIPFPVVPGSFTIGIVDIKNGNDNNVNMPEYRKVVWEAEYTDRLGKDSNIERTMNAIDSVFQLNPLY